MVAGRTTDRLLERADRPVPDLLDARRRQPSAPPLTTGGGLRDTRLVAERPLDRLQLSARLLEARPHAGGRLGRAATAAGLSADRDLAHLDAGRAHRLRSR